MKVLLLGEFSGLHKNLKEGLEALGHHVDIASSGDGWKEINSNIDLSSKYSGAVGKIDKLFKLTKALPRFRGYDVVQLMAPIVFPNIIGLNLFIIKYLSKSNGKLFLLGAGAVGENSALGDFFENEYKYPELYNEVYSRGYDSWGQTPAGRRYNKWLLNIIDGYIPIMYEYAEAYRNINYEKLCPTIPIPINIDKIKYRMKEDNDKIVIFHGLNRPCEKGTPLIKAAMDKLQKDYPNDVECIIDGKMPLKDYLKLLNKVDIVVDQVYSVSVGMNGVYNLAMGKVVVGGGEEEFLKEFNLSTSPLVKIQASIDDIYKQLQFLVINKEEIKKISIESRKFAERVHNHKEVASKYLLVWGSN